ncbi:MAG: hypothetical protein JWN70_794 [Planctomycetaceae bacterium]|nr:hypothetical protein [Planctomycetaceae bacterium]
MVTEPIFAMVAEPTLALVTHLISTPRRHLDMVVAGGILVGTLFYMSRIARVCVSYGFDPETAEADEEVAVAAKSDKPYDGPYLAG